jgi:hypothetical protein
MSSLFLKSKDCKTAIVLYHGKTVLTTHDEQTQSLSLPVVPVTRHHLSTILTDSHNNDLVKTVNETVVNTELDPILGAFAYAALEYVINMNFKIRSVKHVRDKSEYLFKCDAFPSITEIFAIEVLSEEIAAMSMVGIKVDKIFCKLGSASNNDMSVYYNGLKIETLSAIVLIEYWNLRFNL